jgi:hypothetical protein
VKLYSSHLLAMALFLVAPDLRRLANLFVLNRPVEPADDRPLFARRGLHRGALVFRTVFVAGFAVLLVYVMFDSFKIYGNPAQRSPLYGVWNVDELEVDGQVRPPLVTDESRWRRVIFDRPQMMGIQLMSDSRQRYRLTLNAARRTLAMAQRDNPKAKSVLSYQRPDPGHLILEGMVDGRKIRARLHLADTSKFPLTTRGFHWINEFPFNR